MRQASNQDFKIAIRLKLTWNLKIGKKKKSNFPVCAVALNRFVLFLHLNYFFDFAVCPSVFPSVFLQK